MTTFIENAGAAIVSRKIVERTGNIKWLTRETPFAPQDSGWRVLSDRDTEEYLSNPANMTVVDFNELCTLVPPAGRLRHSARRRARRPPPLVRQQDRARDHLRLGGGQPHASSRSARHTRVV